MSTLTEKEEDTLRGFLNTRSSLAVGIGTYEEPCSIAAINLALTGRLTDSIPDCMSGAIGRWVIYIQDRMPASIRNSQEWRDALVGAAGTGRAHEPARIRLLLEHMWGVLAFAQPRADRLGYGDAWRTMLEQRTHVAACAAEIAAYPTSSGVAYAATCAGGAIRSAARHTATCAKAPIYGVFVLDNASDVGGFTADAVRAVVRAAVDAIALGAEGTAEEAWRLVDPVGTLKRLVDIEAEQ